MLTEVVRAALAAQPVDARDAALAELSLTYARLLDDAGQLHAAAINALEEWDREDPIGRAHIQKLADALAARQAVNDLGPKLLAALESLLLGPRARAAAKKAVTDAKPAANPLDQLAAARARRGRPEGLDPASP